MRPAEAPVEPRPRRHLRPSLCRRTNPLRRRRPITTAATAEEPLPPRLLHRLTPTLGSFG